MHKKLTRILKLREVEQKIGLKRDSIYRLARQGKLPKPVKLSVHASGWIESELDAFLEGCIRRRDAQ